MSNSDHHNPSQLPKPPRTWLTLLVGATLLITGGVIGAGITVQIVKLRMEQAQSQAMDAPGEMSRRIAERMTRELDLTPEQAEQFRAAFEKHHQGMRTLFGTLQDDIQEILTPEQQERWQEIARRFKRDRRDGGGPRDRDGRGDREHRDGPPRDHRDRDGDYKNREQYRDDRRPADERTRDGERPPQEPDVQRDGRRPLPPPPPDGGFPPPPGDTPPPPPPADTPPQA